MEPSVPENFTRLIAALGPWLDQAVIVGGWAHRLYRLHPSARRPDYRALMTLDADVALPPTLPPREESIRERLLACGFQEEFLGDDRPPVTHYHLRGEAAGFYAEFVTPLVGGPVSRSGAKKTTALVAGVVTQRLRHLELLLLSPWSIDLAMPGGPARIRVPNPASFLAQKALTHQKRSQRKCAKDVLYMHDTLDVFSARLAQLRDEWTNRIAPELPPSSTSKVRTAATRLFGGTSDTIREAARLTVERNLSPDALRQACRLGFQKIFG